MSNAVVIGVGNRWRRDDAAGLEVIDALRGRVDDSVLLVESDGEPTRLLDAFELAAKVIMVDAVVTGECPAGTVHRLTDQELPDQMGIGQSSHLVQLVETIELGKLLDRLPNGLVLVGIEGTDFDNGEGMTEAVTGGVAEAVELVLVELTG